MTSRGRTPTEVDMGTCLECDELFDVEEEMEVGDVFVCPKCKTRLELLDLQPVMVDYAVDEDEEE